MLVRAIVFFTVTEIGYRATGAKYSLGIYKREVVPVT